MKREEVINERKRSGGRESPSHGVKHDWGGFMERGEAPGWLLLKHDRRQIDRKGT